MAKALIDTAILAETIANFMKLPEDYIVDLSYNINNSTIEGFHEIGNSRYINAPYSKTEFKDKKVRRLKIVREQLN